MNRIFVPRRRFLGGLGSAAFALGPLLRTLRAEAAGPPLKRLLIMVSPNGTVPQNFWPASGSETDFTMDKPILQPLAPWKSDLLIIRGFNNRADLGESHTSAAGGVLTGAKRGRPVSVDGKGYAAGPSIDYVLGQKLQGEHPFGSLLFGWESSNSEIANRPNVFVSYRGSEDPIRAEEDPAKMFDQLTRSPQASDPAAQERLRAQRRSTLDLWRADLDRLMGRLGAAERDKVASHLEALRAAERRLQSSADSQVSAACQAAPGGRDDYAGADTQKKADLMITLAVHALACGFSRVATLHWGCENNKTRYPWANANSAHHPTTHTGDQAAVTRMETWHASQFAQVIKKLKETKAANGTSLLQSTLALWIHGMGYGNTHSNTGIPVVIAGQAGGAVRTGRYMQVAGLPHNNLLVAIANAMDVPMATFGREDLCQSPMKLA